MEPVMQSQPPANDTVDPPPTSKWNHVKYALLVIVGILFLVGAWFLYSLLDIDEQYLVAELPFDGRSAITKDAKYVYIDGVRVDNPPLDAQTFELIEGTDTPVVGQPFFRDKNGIYQIRQGSFKVLEGADPATFTSLHNGFIAFDKNHVYLEGEMIPGANSENFRVVAMIQPYEEPAYPGYFLAGNKLYSRNNIANPREVDVATFEVVNANEYIFKDKNGVYYGLEKIEKVDVGSIKAQKSMDDLGQGLTYIISDAAVYVYKEQELEEIPNADPKTFEIVAYSYAKDKNHVYMGANIVENERPSSFNREQAFKLHNNL